jgi:hypothetical protein
MNPEVLALDRRNIRGTDSNSLLRLYDLANKIVAQSSLQLDREKADKALGLISKELQKRNVPHMNGTSNMPDPMSVAPRPPLT